MNAGVLETQKRAPYALELVSYQTRVLCRSSVHT